jgi:HK97 family phage major capsid protein
MSGVTDRLTELKTALASKGEEIKGLSANWKDETGDGKFVLSTEDHAKYVKACNEGQQIRDLIAAEQKAIGIFEFLDAPASGSESAADAATARQPGQFGSKSLSREWLDSEAYAEMKGAAFRQGGSFTIERGVPDLASAAFKDIYSASGGNVTIPGFGTPQNLGLTERMLRPGRVRDLFPAESTTASMLYGIRETGYTNNARVVPERRAADGTSAPTGGATDVYGLKPKSELTIVPVTYPIATIAHIMYIHKNTLDDEPRIRGIIDRDMIDGVKMAEDDQLLWGNGVGDNLTGLMNTSGVQEYSGLSSDRKSAQIRRAATRAILAYFQPTGVVLHPFDWEDIELETDLNGNYTVAVSVAVGGEKRVWRLAVTDTPAMTQGDALIGAFGTGAKLYDREQVTVEVSTENRDMFERNAYTLRAEERLGLVVDRPESFVHLEFTDFVPA